MKVNRKSIFHYTSSLGLLGLLSEEVIRCTNVLFLNDRKEYIDALNFFEQIIENDFKEMSEEDDTFEFLKNVHPEIIGSLHFFKESTYVSCFTENYDNIINWMAYGRGAINYCIEYDMDELAKALKELNTPLLNESFDINSNELQQYFSAKFSKVEYSELDKENRFITPNQFIKSMIFKKSNTPDNDIDIEGEFDNYMNNLLFYIAAVKGNDWGHENEHRIVVTSRNTFDEKGYVRVKKHVKWRDSNGIIVPYIEIPLCNKLIKSVTYLAQHNSERVKNSLEILKDFYSCDFSIKESNTSLVI